MSDVGDSYAKVLINRIELTGLLNKEAPYITLSIGDHKFSSDAHEKEDLNKGRWNINFSFEVSEPKEFATSEVKIAVFRKDKWKKDKIIGEHSIKLSTFLKNSKPISTNTATITEGGAFHTTNCVFPRNKKRTSTTPSSVSNEINATFYIDVTGWKITYDLLNDSQTVPIAISTLSSLAENKSNKKIKSYLRKEILLVLKNLILDETIQIRPQIVSIWGSLAKRDDESLLTIVKEGAVQFLADLLQNVLDLNLQVDLTEILKHFFKYASHQKIMIDTGILKILLKNLVKDNVMLQTKCFEVLLHFDTIHQEEMIKEGIIPILNKLLFSNNIQIQTRTLALIQYFDISYQDKLVKEGMISNIMNLLNNNSNLPLLQLKCLSVLQHFSGKYKDTIINNGILLNLSTLIHSNNSQLQLKAFQVIENFVESHQQDVVKTGILQSLIQFLNDPNFILKLECLSILRCFDIETCIKEGFLDSLNKLLQSKNEAVMIKVLDIISNMNDLYQVQLKDSGILLTLVNLLNTSIPSTDIPNIVKIPSPSNLLSPAPPISNILKNDDFYESIIPGVDYDFVNSNSKWSCSACTFLNDAILDTCSICGTSKPEDIPPIPSQQEDIDTIELQVEDEKVKEIVDEEVVKEVREQSNNEDIIQEEEEEEEAEEDFVETQQTHQQDEAESKWACSACTFLNDEDPLISSCIICNSPKPAPPPPPPQELTNNDSSAIILNNITSNTVVLSSTNESSISSALKCKILHALRIFDVKYQIEMIDSSIISILKSMLLTDNNMDVQKEVVKTISYLTLEHQSLLIQDNILTLLAYLLSPKNAKIFLIVIQMFSGYQEYIIDNNLLGCILKLLSFEDVQLHARIADFLMSFDDKYVIDICKQTKEITSINTSDDNTTATTARCEFCTDCGQIKGHLSNCTSNVFSVNYTLQSQAKKLLWQFEHNGIRILKYGIAYNDGGTLNRKYKVKNILTANSNVYSSKLQSIVNIVYQYKGQGIPYATHIIMKSPRSRFDSPLKSALVFINDDNIPDLKLTSKYDKLSDSQWEDLKKLGVQYSGPNTCMIPLELNDNYYTEIPLLRPTKAIYLHIKLLSAAKQNFDVEYVGVVGISSANVISPLDSPDLDPKVVTDVGNYLGVKKRVKRFDFTSDFDKNGLLYWIGSNANTSDTERLQWVNPVLSGQIALSTSHPMYSGNMKAEDIISREGGNSCYWGGSCPQYFTIDLKQRRLRCNYFTLRHGYQAANSYIQNWSFSCSNDLVHWTTLYEGGETPFNKAFDTKSWPVLDGKEFCRYFRVLQKGNYSMGRGITGGGSAYLCISGFEIYGDLLLD